MWIRRRAVILSAVTPAALLLGCLASPLNTPATLMPPTPSTTVAATLVPLTDLDTSSDDPAPLGVPVAYFDTFLITLKSVVAPADDLVSQASAENPSPSPGFEYMVVALAVECTTPADGICTFLENDLFAVLDETGETYPALDGIVGLDTLAMSSLAPGERSEGILVFETPAASGQVLVFSRFMWGEAYFALR